jgi:general secretion pathway protein H
MTRTPSIRSRRAVTLIELMVVIVLAGLLMAGVVIGMGAATNARVKAAATLVVSGIRVAYNRASASSRPMRLVLDMDRSSVVLEESNVPMLVRRNDETRTGGAEASTQQERDAIKEAERIVEGPKPARPPFRPVKALGFEVDDPGTGRLLGRGVRFKRVEVAHDKKPATEGRAYLYFWSGGMTERAAIQIGRAGESEGILTVLVAPLTGKATIAAGPRSIDSERADGEREDRSF